MYQIQDELEIFYWSSAVWDFIKEKNCTFYWLICNFLLSRENFEKESKRIININISSSLIYLLSPFFILLSVSRLATVCLSLSFDQKFNRILLRNVLIADLQCAFILLKKLLFSQLLYWVAGNKVLILFPAFAFIRGQTFSVMDFTLWTSLAQN